MNPSRKFHLEQEPKPVARSVHNTATSRGHIHQVGTVYKPALPDMSPAEFRANHFGRGTKARNRIRAKANKAKVSDG